MRSGAAAAVVVAVFCVPFRHRVCNHVIAVSNEFQRSHTSNSIHVGEIIQI